MKASEQAASRAESRAIIIGAGPAGLAVGACLARVGIPFTILERERAVGASWRGHYDRLHLHTNKGTSALPFIPFPPDFPRYPSRDQVVAYLESYADAFHLEPRFGEEVITARQRDDRWQVETRQSAYVARHLVVATGLNRDPITPRWQGQDAYRGRIMHARDYRNGAAFRGARVLVVGIGNSGAEIALDLYEHGALPTIAVRGPVNVLPRDILGIPIVAAGRLTRLLPPRVADRINAPLLRLVLGDLQPFGLSRPPYGPLTQIATTGRTPLIDVGTIGAIKAGKIAIRPGIDRVVDDGVVFTDGRREPFDALVLATGYRAGLASFLNIDGALDEQGNPRPDARSLPDGLHLCGFTTTAKGVLHQIARDAPRIAARIASQPV
ncbi:MAG TPA: NAD(P)/FAD-dependent oxidoreductase [Gemmatimonadaceae bacterium]|nr:NAD(P)/FAD-dependent oxidoreductase [Gemmatimonadaceae bacterium]